MTKTNVKAHNRKGTKGVKSHTRTVTDKKVPRSPNYLEEKYRKQREKDKEYLTSRNKAIDEMNSLMTRIERDKEENPDKYSDKFPSTLNRQKDLERVKLLRKYYLNSVGGEYKAVIVDRESGAWTHKRYTTELILMSPDEFLGLARPAVRYNQESIDYNKQSMINGKPIAPLVLDIDVPDNRVHWHEGRHRSEAAKSLGIKRVPVILAHTSNGSSISATKPLDIKTVLKELPK